MLKSLKNESSPSPLLNRTNGPERTEIVVVLAAKCMKTLLGGYQDLGKSKGSWF